MEITVSTRKKIGTTGLTMSLVVIVFALVAIPSAQAQSALSAKGFVQSFYTWYIPQMTKNVPVPSDQRILKERASSFSPTLLAMLKEDLAASAKVTDEIVGLDFDPYINGQDTPKRYLAGKVIPKDKCYWVEVFDLSSGKKGKDPAVIPEVKFVKGQWIFTNFHYPKTHIPENENLIRILKALKASRLQYDKEHKNHSSIK
ncbi:MAG: hypothetical protein QG574_4532 [Cyanobacteriota bacterium erpe_2018_sw_21hr_WHONDRS-SW48-000092_B_bin.40]|nr:hypothetical protein [Cyanobacteriota bacterium erpe_2018_sw_21hr_WHONDRS-SW48-000092_B_bin.40]